MKSEIDLPGQQVTERGPREVLPQSQFHKPIQFVHARAACFKHAKAMTRRKVPGPRHARWVWEYVRSTCRMRNAAAADFQRKFGKAR